MNGLVGRSVFGGLILLCLVAAGASAAVPVIQEGECVYLVGAPPGGQAAADEEKVSGEGWTLESGYSDECGTAIERDGEYMVHAWARMDAVTKPGACWLYAWIGNEFQISSVGPAAPVEVTMEGSFSGQSYNVGAWWGSWVAGGGSLMRAELLEVDPLSGQEIALGSTGIVQAMHSAYHLMLDEEFGIRLDARLRPGVVYRVRLFLDIHVEGGRTYIDFGHPNYPGGFASYDRIKVCVDLPAETALGGIRDRLDELATGQCESIRLLLTPEGRRASDCCSKETSFPDGKSAPSCGGTVLNSPAPPPSPALLADPLQTRKERRKP